MLESAFATILMQWEGLPMPYLVQVKGDKGVQLHALEFPKTLFGRAEHCHVVLQDKSVSRAHASFLRLDGQIAVLDHQSSNGTFVNDIPVHKMFLSSGDRIKMGEFSFIFYEDEPDEDEGLIKRSLVEANTPIRPLAPLEGPTELFRAPTDSVNPQAMKTTYLQLKTLYMLNQEMPQAKSLNELYKVASEAMIHATGAERVIVWECVGNRLANETAHIELSDFVNEELRERPIPERAFQKIWEEKKPLFFQVDQQATAMDSVAIIKDPEQYAMMGAPIRYGGQNYGIFYLETLSGEKRFSKIDLDFTASVAMQIGLFIERLQYTRSLEKNLSSLSRKAGGGANIIGSSEAIRKIHAQIAQVAETESTVLIHGESGTGKEMVARSIHQSSKRREKTFLAVNCAAMPENLFESELFGYEKGAFTGAYARKIGHFETANNGTLFLDEIGELTPSAQAKLLRVLQEGEIMRVGGNKPIRIDVRIVAATNRDLTAMVKAGAYREDLYYRLNVVELTLPPLRSRQEDIPILAEYFHQQLRESFVNSPGISAEAVKALEKYNWPGNIRQLRNAIEHALVMAEGKHIAPTHLPSYVRSISSAPTAPAVNPDARIEPAALSAIEKKHIAYALEYFDNNKQKTAQALGISRSTLYEKMKTYDLEK